MMAPCIDKIYLTNKQHNILCTPEALYEPLNTKANLNVFDGKSNPMRQFEFFILLFEFCNYRIDKEFFL